MAEIPLENIVDVSAKDWCEANDVPMSRYKFVTVKVKGIQAPLLPLGADSDGIVKRALARAAPYEAEAIVNFMQDGYFIMDGYGLALVPKEAD